jgi:hypothetical protein
VNATEARPGSLLFRGQVNNGQYLGTAYIFNRYDNGRSVSELAEQIMGVCTVERFKMRQAFHISFKDPDIEPDEYKQALRIAEDVRKNRDRR